MKKIYPTLLLLFFPFLASAHYGDGSFGHHMNMGYGSFGGGILEILFWILIVIGIIYLVKHLSRGREKGERKEERAIEILKERYARGEISKEEFEQKKKELQ